MSSDRPWLTFDCYDTLVAYSEAKTVALAALVRAKDGDDRAIDLAQDAFETEERRLQTGAEFVILNQVLRRSLAAALAATGLLAIPEDEHTMIEAVRASEPFPDVASALRDLKTDHRLAILSNSEPDIIIHSIARIGVAMDAVVLASEAQCYKPATGMFKELLNRIDARAADVTHIAQGFYHDIRPTKDLGFGRRIWINRYARDGDAGYAPDAELMDLAGLREALA